MENLMITAEHFDNNNMLSKEWKDYAVGKMMSFMELSDEQLDHIIDSDLLNPMLSEPTRVSTPEGFSALHNKSTFGTMAIADIAIQEDGIRERKSFKAKVKEILCSMAEVIAKLDNLNGIISRVLLTLVAAFGGGIGALLLPVVVGLIVKFIKKGYEVFCEV